LDVHARRWAEPRLDKVAPGKAHLRVEGERLLIGRHRNPADTSFAGDSSNVQH
jgi:hypothetical protein